MKPIYWIIYVSALFALGYLLAHVTAKKPPPRRTRPAIDTKHLDLDFTHLEGK